MTDNKAGIKPIKIIGINPKGEEWKTFISKTKKVEPNINDVKANIKAKIDSQEFFLWFCWLFCDCFIIY
jgi:hypothetical protein